MTERERIDFSSEMLKKYGVPFHVDSEVLPILMSIHDLEKECVQKIEAVTKICVEKIELATKKINDSQKKIQVNSPLQAFLYGFGKYGIVGILIGIAVIYLSVSLVSIKRDSSGLSERENLNQSLNLVSDSLHSLGFLKTVQIHEDNFGKYFILENSAGSKEKKAGKNYELFQQGGKTYAKIYTEFFKQ